MPDWRRARTAWPDRWAGWWTLGHCLACAGSDVRAGQVGGMADRSRCQACGGARPTPGPARGETVALRGQPEAQATLSSLPRCPSVPQ
jgi:hypothetical protein